VSTATSSPPKHSNRLADEKSPYLLQHAHNPVNWFPWGDEAFAAARAKDLPIFLSVGYSTCHWCHVMERESFEAESTAAFLNEHFVSIKVDREERPDIDKIYMSFVQGTTGSGGWPLNAFLTPALEPFYGGTYFPPESRYGRPSFLEVLKKVAELWKTRRQDIQESSKDITSRLRSMAEYEAHNAYPAGERELHGAGETFLHEYDPQHGGFGGAPKFPRPSVPLYLLRYARRFNDAHATQAVLHTCKAMASGGMADQLGGGFARYSVDEKWLVPHFEKMLYDQAQLVNLYLEAFVVSGESVHAKVARDTLHYVLRDMTHPEGGFFSAEDADSEGHEGKFYCWTREDLERALSPLEYKVALRHYGITEAGNFVDHSHPQPLLKQNVLSIVDAKLSDAESEALETARRKLFELRKHRVRPHLDDKVLASWNGMMLSAMARAYAVLGEREFLRAAERNLEFLRAKLWDPSTHTLYHRWRDGQRDSVQLLDAYAHVAAGVLDLYEATLNPAHLEFAVTLAESMNTRFYDAVNGGFWQTVADAPHLLLRNKEDYDGAEPSGNSVAALVLLRLAVICDRPGWRQAAEKTIRLFAQRLHQFPQAVPHLLMALDFAMQEPHRIVLVGDWNCGSTEELLKAAHRTFQPNKVILGNQGPVEEFARRLPPNPEFTIAYCCTGTECLPPTREISKVQEFLAKNDHPSHP